MSLQAELVRLWLRWAMKRSNHPNVTIPERRRRMARFERRVPRPPGWIEMSERPLGGIPALRVRSLASQPVRQILFLHGGGYVTGGPALYRHILWRFAAGAEASVAAIDYRLAPEHPFPAALDDAVAAWRGLLAEGADPRRCAVAAPRTAWLTRCGRCADEAAGLFVALMDATFATARACKPSLCGCGCAGR